MTKERKCLLAISVLMQVIFTFFDIFFNIYVYDISKNLNIIITYTIINSFVVLLINLCLYKLLSKKVLSFLYKLSFVMSIVAIALTFSIDTTRIYMVFVTQIFLKITNVFYYLPHEVATMNKNKKSQMRRFLGLSSALSIISGFLSPLLSGIIIDYFSYYIIFIILIILSAICFALSFNIEIVKEDNQKLGLLKFIKQSHQDKGMKQGYLSRLFYNLCNDGVVNMFLPVLIFIKTGTNFSVGIYSAVASLLSGIALIIYCYYSKNKPHAMWLFTIFQVVVSLCIILWNNIVVFFVYYFVKKITAKILHNGVNENTFSLVHGSRLEPYTIENFYVYNFYHHGGVIIACIMCLIVYNIWNNALAITILIAAFSLVQILSTYLLNKSDENLMLNKQDEELLQNTIKVSN